MKAVFKTLALVVLLNAGYTAAQSSAAAKPQMVKWEAVAGNNNEFLIYMPQGYSTASDGGYITGKPGQGGRVERKITAYRYINGVVLMMEYYEGDAKVIEKSLQAVERSAGDRRQVNGFDVSQFDSDLNGYAAKKQYFRLKNRLYVVSTVSRSSTDPIVDGFLKSVHLANGKEIVQPNVPAGTASMTLKGIPERAAVAAGDAAIDGKLADRKVIVIHTPRPKYPSRDVGQVGKVKLKVLYSVTGKVADVEVIESPSKSISKAAVEAAKQTVFVPAEKDGQLVSVHDVLEYSFTSTVGGFIL